MMTLYLVRHAKSSWENPDLSDFERPLNERGRRDAPRMGKRLKEREIVPDLMLSSPAKRAITTCKEIASILSYDVSRIKTDRRIYHASEDELLDILSKLNDTQKKVMIFGHNPAFTNLANTLFNEHIMNIPTCGIVGGSLKIKSWSEISVGCGKLDFFDFPKKNKKKN
ncbi:MAG TPA: histidine phosphatase family protein [Cyclobacteriaceae bacterium]|nr:histidine phosphatase family protein [Cyclobacteriaceae bacterium]